MTAIENIQQACDTLTRLKAVATQGHWFWENPDTREFPQSDQSLLATHGGWRACECDCTFPDTSNTSRGRSGAPGHEHLETEPVLKGWGYDASGIEGSEVDRELIVTLHRTIDAQLAVLQEAIRQASDPRFAFPFPFTGYDRASLALADAILAAKGEKR